jgi:LacI family transcriptional regulator
MTEINPVIRIKDIAEKAGVSTGTVDRVLHNRGRVSEQVKEKVLQIARELNYEPNYLAQALVSKRNYRIAALIPDPNCDEYWQAPMQGARKADHTLRQLGVLVVFHIFNPFDVETFKAEAQKVSELSYDGILLAPIFFKESLTYMSKWKIAGIPFNLFNTHIPDYEPLSYIGQDSYQSGILAGKLLHYGHPSRATFIVAHVDENIQNSSHLIKKEQGFIDYFNQHTNGEFQILQADLKQSTHESIFFNQLDHLFDTHPETAGIFVTNSRAFTIASYLSKRNLSQVRLVGYDLLTKNLDFLAKGIINFLINQNPYKQGYLGIYLLIDHLIFKKKITPIKYLPLDIITSENLYYYLESE